VTRSSDPPAAAAPPKPARIDLRSPMMLVAAVGALLLVIAGVAMVHFSEQSYREAKLQQIDAQGRILASTVTAALAFDDRAAAQEYVNALDVDPQIQIAAVYDAAGNLFASHARDPAQPAPAAVTPGPPRFEGDGLVVTAPVKQGDATVGTVYVHSLIEPISRRLERYGVVALLVAMAALIFVLLGAAQSRLADANIRLSRQGAALAEANRELRAQIEQREQAETALRQAQKMEAIGQLTGGIAHDFNNLLQVILGNLEVVQRRDLVENDVARRLVAAAARSAERAATLTQRLLAFARRQPLNPNPVDVNKLVAGMSELLRRSLGEGIIIETVLASGLWRVTVDANQLENALLNLAVNARDAMPSGGRLTIETGNTHLDEAYASAQEVKAGQYVSVAVTDTGTGMTQDVLQKAFEPFFTTKDFGKGSGLGLSQAYGFMRQSGGHVKIYSEVGQGTTVRLYLPRIADEAEVLAADNAEALPRGSLDRLILVVEDEPEVRAHAVTMLRELGYGVVEAMDGKSALEIFDATPDIAMLFTDVGLPGMNGRELADEARRRRPGLRVLFTTGYARDAIVHNGRLDAGVELLTKPFTYAALSTKVHRMLSGETP